MIEQTETGDVRAYKFFSDYGCVFKALGKLQSQDGLVLGEGVRRNADTGLVDGFEGNSLDQ